MRVISSVLFGATLALVGCGDNAPTAESCGAICDAAVKAALEAQAPKGVALTTFEASILSSALEQVRLGVQPWDEHGIGICKGQGKDCEEWIGTDAGVLPAGEYMLRADLRVPNVGPRGTWKINVSTTCKTTLVKGGQSRSSDNNRNIDYDVAYAGDTRGYRLSPLIKLTSPSDRGTEECQWTITAPHGDGNKVWSGSWTLPQIPDTEAPAAPAAP